MVLQSSAKTVVLVGLKGKSHSTGGYCHRESTKSVNQWHQEMALSFKKVGNHCPISCLCWVRR